MSLSRRRALEVARRWALVALLTAAPLAGQSVPAHTVPAHTVPAHTVPARVTVDHAVFDTLLRAHVRDGLVDYDAFRDAAAFRRYLTSLARASLTGADDDERLAFWLNVYNAYTIQLIATHGERESIRNINRTLGVLRLKGPWSEPLVRAAGRTLTLDEVEHRIIRKDFHDPRIHFALVSAAKGSPPLRSEAYTGAELERQLFDQGKRFLTDTTWNQIDTRYPRLSPIFTYYMSLRDAGDFLRLGPQRAGASALTSPCQRYCSPRAVTRAVLPASKCTGLFPGAAHAPSRSPASHARPLDPFRQAVARPGRTRVPDCLRGRLRVQRVLTGRAAGSAFRVPAAARLSARPPLSLLPHHGKTAPTRAPRVARARRHSWP